MTDIGSGDVATDRPDELRSTAESLARLTRDLPRDDPRASLDALVERGATDLVGARWASVTVLRQGRFQTVASNHPDAITIDHVQYEVGTGPCVDAVLEDATFVTGDVMKEARWRPVAERVHEMFGVTSMLAYRLHLLDESETIAGLNFSSDERDAFSEADIHRGLVFATHCALLVTASQAHDKAGHLLRALESNREIGVAVGILMAQHRLTREQAFDVLRLASQRTNRKLVDVASDVADTGLAPGPIGTDGTPG